MSSVPVSRVRVGAVDVAYTVEGEGPPLVHGTTQSRMAWLQLAPLLTPSLQLILPDLPGSGDTVDPGGPLEVADLAAQTVAVADALGHDRFHLAGYSLGAVVAAEAAAQVGNRVRSLTLLCGWATTDARMRFTFDLWERLLKADPELFARYVFADGFTAASFELFGTTVEELLPLTAAGFAPGSDRHLELDRGIDIAHRLSSISAPTLVVGGLEDRWVDIRHSRELAERIPTARLVELPCGHVGPLTELVGGGLDDDRGARRSPLTPANASSLRCRPVPTTRTLSEAASKRLLAAHGVPVAPERIVADAQAAAAAAGELGLPVVVKLNGDGIAHKTERGLVRLDLGSIEAVERAGAELLAAATPADGAVELLVAPMVKGNRELIAGLTTDPQFGMTVMLGVGGILAEALADVVFRLVPIDRVDAFDMIDQLHTQPLLAPFRGEPAVDRELLADVLVGLSAAAEADASIVSADLNPLIVAGGTPVAVDALVEVRV